MTPKERVVAQIEHRETDFIPYTLSFEIDPNKTIENDVLERMNAHYGNDSWQSKLDDHVVRIDAGILGMVPDSGTAISVDKYGTEWRADKRPWHMTKPALEKPDLSEYTFPEIDSLFDEDWQEKTLQEINKNRDHFLVASFGFGLFERTWAMRGFENALVDAIAHEDFYRELVQKIFEQQMMFVDRLLTLPFDGIMFGDDWGHQDGIIIGAERWRKYFKPYMAKLYERVHQAGRCTLNHICGSVIEILPDLIEIGLDVYESVQPEARNNNPYQLKKLYGKEITFWGGLGSQSTIPFGTPSKIKSEIRRLCKEMGKGGGYILSSAKAIQPETPTENAVAVIEAFAEQAGIPA